MTHEQIKQLAEDVLQLHRPDAETVVGRYGCANHLSDPQEDCEYCKINDRLFTAREETVRSSCLRANQLLKRL